jgi:hypothetical protein
MPLRGVCSQLTEDEHGSVLPGLELELVGQTRELEPQHLPAAVRNQVCAPRRLRLRSVRELAQVEERLL